jgi:hypothetical protein
MEIIFFLSLYLPLPLLLATEQKLYFALCVFEWLGGGMAALPGIVVYMKRSILLSKCNL